MSGKNLPKVHTTANDEVGEIWTVNCPECDKEEKYSGWFDSTEKHECENCKCEFYASKCWVDETHYIT